MSNEQSTALAPYEASSVGIVTPLADPRTAAAAIRQYEALKQAIVQPSDIQKIQGREFLKKAFWRRVATCFGLSLELVSEARGHDEKGGLYYSVIYKAIAPNGRTMTADGYCSQSESGRGGWPEHNVRATAHTRAKNRAISDLVGGGEVSAEEIGDEYDHEPQAPAQPRPAQPTQMRQAAPAQPAQLATWAALRKQGIALGLATQDAWESYVKGVTGKIDARSFDNSDRGKVAEALKRREMQTVDGEVVDAGFPTEDVEHDLSTLDTDRVRVS